MENARTAKDWLSKEKKKILTLTNKSVNLFYVFVMVMLSHNRTEKIQGFH